MNIEIRYGRSRAFAVPFAPVPQPRARHGQRRTYQAASDHPIHTYKGLVKLYAQQAGVKPLAGPVSCDLVFVFPRIKDLPKRGPRVWKDTTPDRDNLDKAVLDALKRVAWKDDGQLCDGRIMKFYAASGEQPHVEVRIRELLPIPAQGAK